MANGGTLVGSLLYPDLRDGCDVIEIRFAYQAAAGGPSISESALPFCASLDDRILVVELAFRTLSGNRGAVWIHCLAVSALVDKNPGHSPLPLYPLPTEWKEWARQSSQLFYDRGSDIMDDKLIASHGARYIDCSYVVIGGIPKLRLTLRDFSRKGFYKGIAAATVQSGAEYGWSYHCDDKSDFAQREISSLDKFFDVDNIDQMTTALPYRSVSRLIDVPHGAVASRCSAVMAESSIVLCCEGVSAHIPIYLAGLILYS
jgi:hypothetical protein